MRRPVGTPHIKMNSRRQWLLAATAATWDAAFAKTQRPKAEEPGAARSSHFPFGPVVPARKLDPWPVTTHLGFATNLPALLRGKVTAVQLMFTGCSATCPIQGALFAQARRELKQPIKGSQFLSISIDALNDTPAGLQKWLKQFDAGADWLAAVPRVTDTDAIIQRLSSGGEKPTPGPDPHTGQVYVFDRRGELVYRTPSMPLATQIVEAMRLVDLRG